MKIKNSNKHENEVKKKLINNTSSFIVNKLLFKTNLFSQENAILLTVFLVMFSAAKYNRFQIYMAG